MRPRQLRNFIAVWPDRTVTFGNATDIEAFKDRLALQGRTDRGDITEYSGLFSFGLKFRLSGVDSVRGNSNPELPTHTSKASPRARDSPFGAASAADHATTGSNYNSRPWPLEHYFGNTEFADIILRIGDEDIPAHKVVLASGSTRLAQMCRSLSPDAAKHASGKDLLEISDVPSESFYMMLHWCYTGTVHIAPPEVVTSNFFSDEPFYQQQQQQQQQQQPDYFMAERLSGISEAATHKSDGKRLLLIAQTAQIAQEYGMPSFRNGLDEELLAEVSHYQWKCFHRVQQLSQIYLNIHHSFAKRDMDIFVRILDIAFRMRLSQSFAFLKQHAVDEIEVLQGWSGGRLWSEFSDALRKEILDAERKIAADRILKLIPDEFGDTNPKTVLKEALKYHPVARRRYANEISDRHSKYSEKSSQTKKRLRKGNHSPESNDISDGRPPSPLGEGMIVTEDEIAHAKTTGELALAEISTLLPRIPAVDFKEVATICSDALSVVRPTLKAMEQMTVQIGSVQEFQAVMDSLTYIERQLQYYLYEALRPIIRREAKDVCSMYLSEWLLNHARLVDEAVSEAELLRSTLPLQIDNVNACNDNGFEAAITQLVFPRTHEAIEAKAPAPSDMFGMTSLFPLSFPTPSMTSMHSQVPTTISIAEALKEDLAASEEKSLVENTELFLRSLDGDQMAKGLLLSGGSAPVSPMHSIAPPRRNSSSVASTVAAAAAASASVPREQQPARYLPCTQVTTAAPLVYS